MLHTSDCHLGSGAPGREERAFEQAMALARREGVDAALIVGDLFDSPRASDEILDWTADQLDSLHCPVVIIPGNHDQLDERSPHHRFDVGTRLAHVTFIDDADGTAVELEGTDIVVWGRAMVEHEPGYRPFAGLPSPPRDRWSIALGHGLVLDDGPNMRSSPIFESDLYEVRWDYVALGHQHAYEEVRNRPTPVRYCGATAASRGGVPGVVLVDFVPGEDTHPRWVPLGEGPTTAGGVAL